MPDGFPAAPSSPMGLGERMRRGELMSAACPSREVLVHLTSRWGVLLLVALRTGTHRFSDLRRRVGGVSEKMLAQTLKWLEADGLVLRDSRATVPPHVEYSLTPLGREAAERVAALADWVEERLPHILDARAALGSPPLASRADTLLAQRRLPRSGRTAVRPPAHDGRPAKAGTPAGAVTAGKLSRARPTQKA